MPSTELTRLVWVPGADGGGGSSLLASIPNLGLGLKKYRKAAITFLTRHFFLALILTCPVLGASSMTSLSEEDDSRPSDTCIIFISNQIAGLSHGDESYADHYLMAPVDDGAVSAMLLVRQRHCLRLVLEVLR